jgi:hypothetical protein
MKVSRLTVLWVAAVVAGGCDSGPAVPPPKAPAQHRNLMPPEDARDRRADAGRIAVWTNGVAVPGGVVDVGNITSRFVVINTPMKTRAATRPAQDYTGLPVNVVLAAAVSNREARTVEVIGRDSYVQVFPYAEIVANDTIILVPDKTGACNLVAKDKPAFLWVRDVVRLNVQ